MADAFLRSGAKWTSRLVNQAGLAYELRYWGGVAIHAAVFVEGI